MAFNLSTRTITYTFSQPTLSQSNYEERKITSKLSSRQIAIDEVPTSNYESISRRREAIATPRKFGKKIEIIALARFIKDERVESIDANHMQMARCKDCNS